MPKETQPQKEHLKVTDKRIFTAEGEIREEFREEIRPADPARRRSETPAPPAQEPRPQPRQEGEGDRRRSVAEKAASPGTAFANFIEPLIAQAYMNLGMLPNPYSPQAKPDPAAARQMIEILTLLQQKTAGNLTPEEDDFLTTHIGELKLAFVKRTKSL
ncbi:MAG TPA: DUF1844 domain-containing protein [Thermoanaerobaculia bacterium]|nr:DUF1844 domain-containing protein [Thermoanaerobaculia bacterium]